MSVGDVAADFVLEERAGVEGVDDAGNVFLVGVAVIRGK